MSASGHCVLSVLSRSLWDGPRARGQREEIAAQALIQLGMEPLVYDSTSWRHADREVVLIYIAVVVLDTVGPESWLTAEGMHSELARGGVTAPPSFIGVDQVREQGLRHLAWLRQDDSVISDLLADLSSVLSDYIPEPFMARVQSGFVTGREGHVLIQYTRR